MPYAYSVAIKLSVANLASQGLRLIAKDMLAAHGIASNLQTKLSALKLAAVGYGLTRAGEGIFHGLEKTVSAAHEYTSQLSLMNAAGMSHAEVINSIGSAWATSRSVLTSTATDNLRTLREMRSLFGDLHMNEAYAVLPTVARTQAMMQALTGRRDERIGMEMARVAELRQTGVMTLPFLQRNLDQLSRTLYAMGGTITASDYLTTMKYAKTAALSLSDQFVYRELPSLIQEVKSAGGGIMGNASQAGTALMTLYSAVVEGKMPKASIPLWMATGLVKPSDVIRNATGHWQARPGSIEGARLFQSDPFQWAQMVAPQLEGYARKHHLSLIQVVSNMFSARNAQWMMNTLIAKAPQIERDAMLIGKTPNSLAIYQNLLKTNPDLAQAALSAQWQNVLTVIGYQIMPKLVPLMVSFAGDLNSLAGWFRDHPKITRAVVWDLAALSAGLVVLGNVMLARSVINFIGLGPVLTKAFTGTAGAAMGLVRSLGALSAAAAAGYWVGSEIWKRSLEGTKVGDKIGEFEAHILAAFGSKTAQDSLRLNQAYSLSQARAPIPSYQRGVIERPTTPATSYVMSRAGGPTVVNFHVDSKKLATVMVPATTRAFTKAFAGPETGPSHFDGSAALTPAGGVYPR